MQGFGPLQNWDRGAAVHRRYLDGNFDHTCISSSGITEIGGGFDLEYTGHHGRLPCNWSQVPHIALLATGAPRCNALKATPHLDLAGNRRTLGVLASAHRFRYSTYPYLYHYCGQGAVPNSALS